MRTVKAGSAAAFGALGVALALVIAPAAMATPDVPVDPAVPVVLHESAPVVQPAAPPPAAAPLPVPAPDPAIPAQAVAVSSSPTPPDGVPHLTTPDHLPPGTTQEKTQNQGGTRGYLKDIWQAVRSGDVSTGEALLLIAQRPMNSTTALKDMTPRHSTAPVGAGPVPAPDAPAPPAVPAPGSVAPPADAPQLLPTP